MTSTYFLKSWDKSRPKLINNHYLAKRSARRRPYVRTAAFCPPQEREMTRRGRRVGEITAITILNSPPPLCCFIIMIWSRQSHRTGCDGSRRNRRSRNRGEDNEPRIIDVTTKLCYHSIRWNRGT